MAAAQRGANWGFLSVDEATGSLEMRDPAAPDAAPYVTVSKKLIGDVQATRTDLIVSVKPGNDDGLKEMKFTIPKESHGFEGVADPVKLVHGKVQKATGAGAAAEKPSGDAVGKFDNIVLNQPNGTFNVVIHTGSIHLTDVKSKVTHRVEMSNVSRLFLLPVPQNEAKYFVVVLKAALRVGSQQHQCLVFTIDDNLAVDPADPWRPTGATSQADIAKLFPSLPEDKCLIKPEMSGPVCEIIASVFKTVAQVPLSGANPDFMSVDSGTSAVRASRNSTNGWLFVLKNFLLFLHRPATLVPYTGLKVAESQVFSTTATVTFEVLREGGAKEKVSFGGIAAKPDFTNLFGYLGTKGVDVPTAGEGDDEEDEEDDEEDESYEAGSDSDDGGDDDFDDSEDDDAPRKKKDKKSKKEKKHKKDKKHKKEKKAKKHRAE